MAAYLRPRVIARIAQRIASGKKHIQKEADNEAKFSEALFKAITHKRGSSYEQPIDVLAIPEQVRSSAYMHFLS